MVPHFAKTILQKTNHIWACVYYFDKIHKYVDMVLPVNRPAALDGQGFQPVSGESAQIGWQVKIQNHISSTSKLTHARHNTFP